VTCAGDDTAQTAAVEAEPRVPDLAGRRLTIRADGDPEIGTGHLMRCLAIASRWISAGGAVRLACTAVPATLAERYRAAGAEVAERAAWPAADVLSGADAVIADHPRMADAELAALAGGPPVLIAIDDMGSRAAYPGDVVLNQNAHATPALYRGKTRALLCLGAPWSLLREGFARHRATPRPVPDAVGRIVVLLGGADPKRYSAPTLDAVARAAATLSPAPEVVLVVGAANPALPELQRQAATLPGRVTVRHDVRDMPALMAGSDIAVSAGGSTVWELATLGVPMILAAQNASETGPGTGLQAAGAAVYLGAFEGLRPETLATAVTELAGDPARRRAMHRAGMQLADGRGVDRLLALVARLMAERRKVGRQPAQR
jgi:spore coat polysaccharide biosynthesis predicted glycosyltransferase SpsG